MVIDIGSIDGWEEDRWKSKKPGSYAIFLAKNKFDGNVKVFLTDPGGRGDNWEVNVGVSNRPFKYKNIFPNLKTFEDKETALLNAALWMKLNTNVKYNKKGAIQFTNPNGDKLKTP